MIVITIWKEAGFFMIFYLAALQNISPELKEAAVLEGSSKFYFSQSTLKICQTHVRVRVSIQKMNTKNV